MIKTLLSYHRCPSPCFGHPPPTTPMMVHAPGECFLCMFPVSPCAPFEGLLTAGRGISRSERAPRPPTRQRALATSPPPRLKHLSPSREPRLIADRAKSWVPPPCLLHLPPCSLFGPRAQQETRDQHTTGKKKHCAQKSYHPTANNAHLPTPYEVRRKHLVFAEGFDHEPATRDTGRKKTESRNRPLVRTMPRLVGKIQTRFHRPVHLKCQEAASSLPQTRLR